MNLNTTEAIQEEFRTATREHLMKYLRHKIDFTRFHKIEVEAKERTAQEKEDWQQSYHARFAEARQIILRETHGNILEPPKPEGVDTIPNKQVLNQKADARIRQDHERRLTVIKQDEIDQYQELRDTIRTRDKLQGHATQEFKWAQTRSGPSQT